MTPVGSQRVQHLILSAAFLLHVLAPAYHSLDPSTRIPLLFPIAGGLVLIALGRYTMDAVVLALALLFYVSLLVLANGADSVRLGAVSAIFLGLMFSRVRVSKIVLWLSVAYVAQLLYFHTEAFSSAVWEQLTENMSQNYFSEALCYVFLATLLRKSRERETALVLAVLAVSLVTATFIPSRQVLAVALFAGGYLVLTGRRPLATAFFLATAALGALYVSGYIEEVAAVNRLLDAGIQSPRGAVFQCYMENLSVRDLTLGSDHTLSGACAVGILGVTYLHSGYLETINQLGMLGVLILVFYPVAFGYFAWRGQGQMVLALLLVAVYQLAEAGFMWVYFLVLFKLLDDLRESRVAPHLQAAPSSIR